MIIFIGLIYHFCRIFVQGVVIWLLFASSLSFAKTVRLFDQGVQVGNYEILLENLSLGDVLEFEDGSRFEFAGSLGSGNTTQILLVKITDGRELALRLPLRKGNFRQGFTETAYTTFLRDFIYNYKPLELAGLIPHVYSVLDPQFVALEKVSEAFTLEEFLSLKVQMDSEFRQKAEVALDEFARKLAAFTTIDDFSFVQVVYDGNQWILLDFLDVLLFEGEVHPIVFSSSSPFQKLNKSYEKSFSQEAIAYTEKRMKSILEVTRIERIKMLAAGKNPISQNPLKLKMAEGYKQNYLEIEKAVYARKCIDLFNELEGI